MSKKEKGEFGYLKYKRSFNLLLTIIAFLIIAAVFVTGLIIFKSRNNYMTLVATVLVLPGAKIAVSILYYCHIRYVIRNYIQALKLQRESYQLYMM